MPRSTERVQFAGTGGVTLAGRLDRPEGPPRAYALFAHCFTCSKDLKAAAWISRRLAERQVAVLRFDFTGIGESEGDFADTNFSSNLDDLVAAADYLRRHHRPPSILIGHSLGGAAVLAAAPRIPESAAVVTIAAPSDTEHFRGILLARAPGLAETGEARIEIGGQPFTVRRQLLEDLAEDRVRDNLGHLGRALLIFHSVDDRTVDVEHGHRLFAAAAEPKSLVTLAGADHLLSDERDARFVAETIAVWAERYVTAAPVEAEAEAGAAAAGEPVPGAEPLGRGEVEVSGDRTRYRQAVRTERHRSVADEPVAAGGGDRGPAPYELLLGALGACTSITLRMYADRKDWPLEAVRVRLRHRRLKEGEEGGPGELVERDIALAGPLGAEQRDRLLEIANRCPVHRTLSGGVAVRSRLVP